MISLELIKLFFGAERPFKNLGPWENRVNENLLWRKGWESLV